MTSKPRQESVNGVYHVIMRGNNQMQIFCDSEDILKMMYIIKDLQEMESLDIYAYCFMGNHVHFMLHTNDNLSKLFQRIEISYIRWYNKKYERVGHVFQGRFISKAVEHSDYYLAGMQYIFNNPVKAGLCTSPYNYKWSSLREMFLPVAGVPKICVPYRNLPLHDRLNIMDSKLDLTDWEPNARLTDAELKEAVMDLLKVEEWKDVQLSSEHEVKNCVVELQRLGASQRTIVRLLGITRHNVRKLLMEA